MSLLQYYFCSIDSASHLFNADSVMDQSHSMDPMNYPSFQPVLHNWLTRGCNPLKRGHYIHLRFKPGVLDTYFAVTDRTQDVVVLSLLSGSEDPALDAKPVSTNLSHYTVEAIRIIQI